MKNFKKLFATPKKTFISIVCIVAALAILGTGTVFAASVIAENSSIGEEKAQNFAFAEAGIDPISAQIISTKFTYKQQQFAYEVKFIANNTKYKYLVNASNGAIIKKEMEVITADGNTETITAQITLDTAKETALNDAGLTLSNVTFTKTKLELKHDFSVYKIEFYSGNMEYEYEINANTGAIYSKSKELFSGQNKINSAQKESSPSLETQPNVNENQQNTSNASQQDANKPQQNTNPSQQDVNNPQQNTNQPQQGTEAFIGLESAKNIALSDAYISSSDATFTKSKLDYDDGTAIYEIEFYTSTHKYEYDIDAATGNILDKDIKTQHSHSSSTESSNAYIDVDNAKSIAVNHAGLSLSEVHFSKAKLDYDDGTAIYEIEFYTSTHKYEYDIDAATGDILDKDIETQHSHSSSTESSNAYIGIDNAKSIAVNHAGLSLSEVHFSKAKLDRDDGIVLYEIEFYKDKVEYEYKIDAQSGSIIESEID